MGAAKRFQTHGGQFNRIEREVGQPELTARAELSLHARFTARRKAPQAPNNRFISTSLAGARVGGQPTRGGSINPVSNLKFV